MEIMYAITPAKRVKFTKKCFEIGAATPINVDAGETAGGFALSYWEVIENVWTPRILAEMRKTGLKSASRPRIMRTFHQGDGGGVITDMMRRWSRRMAADSAHVEIAWIANYNRLMPRSGDPSRWISGADGSGAATAPNMRYWQSQIKIKLSRVDLVIMHGGGADEPGCVIFPILALDRGGCAIVHVELPARPQLAHLAYIFANHFDESRFYITDLGDVFLCGLGLRDRVNRAGERFLLDYVKIARETPGYGPLARAFTESDAYIAWFEIFCAVLTSLAILRARAPAKVPAPADLIRWEKKHNYLLT